MKAGSKASKKRKGRARINAPRHPSGKLIQPTRQEREDDVKAVVRDQRRNHYGVADVDSPYAGSAVGRVYLSGSITKAQADAGLRFAEDFHSYYLLTGIPHPSAQAQNLLKVRGMPSGDRPEAARKAANRVMALETLLGKGDEAGRPITTCVKRVCVQDDLTGMWSRPMLTHLSKGLNMLIEFYGVARAVDG